MKVRGFDGRDRNWRLDKYKVYGDDSKRRSSYHIRARGILCSLLPHDRILEEVKLPGSNKLSRGLLIADFYVPSRMLMVEVHGRQHYEYVSHFHGNRFEFLRARARDRDKVKWCELNEINIVELKYDESDQQWEDRIRSVLQL